MLEGVIKRGTGRKLKDLKLDIAGKTGTTNKKQLTGLSFRTEIQSENGKEPFVKIRKTKAQSSWLRCHA